MRLLALLVLTVACGGGSKPVAAPPPPAPDPIPTTAAPGCDVVADKLAIVVHADKPDAQASAKTEMRARCTEDKWSDEARSCFATVESDAELDGCRQHLDDTQRTGLAKVAGDAAAPVPAATRAPAAAPAPATEATPAAKPAPKKRSTRGAQPKGDSSDPQEGGE